MVSPHCFRLGLSSDNPFGDHSFSSFFSNHKHKVPVLINMVPKIDSCAFPLNTRGDPKVLSLGPPFPQKCIKSLHFCRDYSYTFCALNCGVPKKNLEKHRFYGCYGNHMFGYLEHCTISYATNSLHIEIYDLDLLLYHLFIYLYQ